MYAIEITKGFGPIAFGDTPSQVQNMWQQPLFYEDWMGGNLENLLYFKGLLVGFRGEIDDAPTENSHVCMFRIKADLPLTLWQQPISNATFEAITTLLQHRGYSYEQRETPPQMGSIIDCSPVPLQFIFNRNNCLDEVYIADRS